MESHLSRYGGRENNDEYFLNIFSTLSLVTKESIAILWGSPWEGFSTPEDLRHGVLGTFFLWGYPYFFLFQIKLLFTFYVFCHKSSLYSSFNFLVFFDFILCTNIRLYWNLLHQGDQTISFQFILRKILRTISKSSNILCQNIIRTVSSLVANILLFETIWIRPLSSNFSQHYCLLSSYYNRLVGPIYGFKPLH